MSTHLQSATCLVAGRQLHYVRAGKGPPLIFLHGVLGSHRIWTDLSLDLAHDHLMIAPDLFGHGASDKRTGDYSLGAHAATVRDLLDHLGLSKATIIGHSLGGGIAMQFAYLFPERVEALVLVASGGLGRHVNGLLRAPTLPGAEWVLPVLASRWASDSGRTLGRGLRMLGTGSSRCRTARAGAPSSPRSVPSWVRRGSGSRPWSSSPSCPVPHCWSGVTETG
jgi:pimeloyl-ACP methyl ester carboxylesterase